MVILLVRISVFPLRKNKNKNRTSLEIVRDMLSVATEKCRKTQILYDAHLNYLLLEKYLNILLKNRSIHFFGRSKYNPEKGYRKI